MKLELPTTEASGLIPSTQYPGVYWWHRDGASRPTKTEDDGIYALKMDASGRLQNMVGTQKFPFFPVTGDRNTQWEDLVVDDQGFLWLGEIGANRCTEKQHLYKLREPNPYQPASLPILEAYSFRFPDAAEGCTTRNAEAMLWLDGSLYVFAKSSMHEGVYRVRFSSPQVGTATLTKIGEFNNGLKISAVGVSSDRRRFMIAGHSKFFVFESGNPTLKGDAYLKDILSRNFKWQGVFGAESGKNASVEGGNFVPNTHDLLFVAEGQQIYHATAAAYGGASQGGASQGGGGAEPAGSCTPNDKLVNPCRPWLGAAAADYPEAPSNPGKQIAYHEKRIGQRRLDIAHFYHPAHDDKGPLGDSSTGAAEIDLAMRPGTYVFVNWKPSEVWREAGGGNAKINKKIDRVAQQIKAIAPRKIFMTLHHEPENEVSGGAPRCRASDYSDKPKSGTAAEYRRMWRNVRDRFDNLRVTNVVWVMDYMNYHKYDCLVDAIYPGDDLVDWVMFNAYGSSLNPDMEHNINRFLTLLKNLSGGDHRFVNKPMGIVEWGMAKTSDHREVVDYIAQARRLVNEKRFPQLKAFMVFDGVGPDLHDYRLGYNPTVRKPTLDPNRMQAYHDFANSPAFNR